MADRVKGLGWHVVLHVDGVQEIAKLKTTLRRLPIEFVVDHLSRVRGAESVGHPGFQALLQLLNDTEGCWAKLSTWYRLSDQGPPYDDMTRPATALIEARPDRVIWGSNWPHPILWEGVVPNNGDLLDQFMGWAGNEATIRQILVDNPANLYGFS